MKGKSLAYLAIFGLIAFFAFQVQTQNRTANDGEFVGNPGPNLQVEQWLSEPPKVEGKFMLIDFWATWCGPCVRAIPHMNELHHEFKNELAIIGISREARATVERMKSPVMEYYSAIDTQFRMARFFEIRSIPHVVLMGPDGTVLWKGHPNGLSKEAIRAFLVKGRTATI